MRTLTVPLILEPEMQSELHLPHRNLRIGDLSRPALIDIASWKTQVHMIEDVESIRPEFKRSALSRKPDFSIAINPTRTGSDHAANYAQPYRCGTAVAVP
jgi:hypothetical protein